MTWRRAISSLSSVSIGSIDLAADHLAGVAEVVVVVGVGAAEREHGGDRVAAPPGPACALLVVGARRRHVAQRHPGQAADVDADLHRGRAGQHVDRGPRRLAGTGQAEVDVLEEEFVLLGLGEHLVGLRGVELGGVLGRDDAHRRLGRAGQGALRAGPVVALARPEHRVGGRVQGPDLGGAAVDALVGPGEGPLGEPAALAVAPQPAGFQRDLPARAAGTCLRGSRRTCSAGPAATAASNFFLAAPGGSQLL